MHHAPNPRLQRTRWRSPLSRQPLGVPHQPLWRRVAYVGAAGVLAVAMSGCVSSTSATVKQVGEDRELVLRETEIGLFVGPCAVPGRSESKYWIKLNGPGPIYSPDQFDFVDE